MLLTEPIPPQPADDAGRDVDQRLLSVCHRLLDWMAVKGFDFFPGYADLLAAVDAKEQAVIEDAKARIL